MFSISFAVVGLPGFEPGSLASEAKSLDQASRQPHANQESKPSTYLLIPNLIPKAISIDWKSYTQWYLQNHNKNTLGYALNYARKYADVLADPSSAHRITSLSKAKKSARVGSEHSEGTTEETEDQTSESEQVEASTS